VKTSISSNNPFGMDHLNWAYGWEFIGDNKTVLDYGCFDGKFINALAKSKAVQVFGADKNQNIVKSVNQNNIVHIQKALPFKEGSFDVVTMFEVLEHVHDQKYVLSEIHRVLKDGGLFILSVPQKHIFSFLDWGNWKYLFPKLHKYWYTKKHSASEYHYRYVDNPNGLIGDVDKEKAWHQHFEMNELSDLLTSNGFEIKDLDGFGVFGIPLALIKMSLKISVPKRLAHWQMTRFHHEKILCVARKIS
jgi:2-polyprenyl-3-methyl-5-hydroxy-6-metoxy-1,4-benzoquinol methylase